MPTQLLIDIAINAALYNLLLVGYQFNSILKQTSNFAFGGLVVLGGYLFWHGRQSGWGALLTSWSISPNHPFRLYLYFICKSK